MKIPILSGIYTDNNSDIRQSLPVNLMPLPGQTGVSDSYLRPSLGVITLGTGVGRDRGGHNWDGVCYRASGTSLISVSSTGAVTTIGTIGGTDLARFDHSFDYLSVNTNNDLWLYDGTTLTQVTDTDLGDCVDHLWVDGYFLSTDGEYIVSTELSNPFSVNATKYASSEFDPDPILALLKPRNEPHALNRYTIEVFYNVGGTGFPFAKNRSAVITKGTVGTRTCCVMSDLIAFMGSGKDESISIYVGAGGQASKIASREVDFILSNYTEDELSESLLETRRDETETLYVHLPDMTLVYDKDVSNMFGYPAWYILSNGIEQEFISIRTFDGLKKFNARNMVRCYNQWIVGDPDSTNIGYLSKTLQSMYGSDIRWAFDTPMIYNGGRGALVRELELVGVTGRNDLGDNPSIFTRYSHDGQLYSQKKRVRLGNARDKRMIWRNNGMIKNYRIQEFTGISDAMASFMRLEAQLEPLNA